MKNFVERHKKLLFMVLLVVVIFTGSICFVGFSGDAPKKLSELSEEELYQFLADRGVTFPEYATPHSINALIAEIENDPAYDPAMSWTVAVELIAAVREVVNEYYGITVEK